MWSPYVIFFKEALPANRTYEAEEWVGHFTQNKPKTVTSPYMKWKLTLTCLILFYTTHFLLSVSFLCWVSLQEVLLHGETLHLLISPGLYINCRLCQQQHSQPQSFPISLNPFLVLGPFCKTLNATLFPCFCFSHFQITVVISAGQKHVFLKKIFHLVPNISDKHIWLRQNTTNTFAKIAASSIGVLAVKRRWIFNETNH